MQKEQFADDNGEDGTIDIAEMALWNRALSRAEVVALGGYGHGGSGLVDRSPYLQTPTPSSISISWHDSTATGTAVEFGSTPALGSRTDGASELVAPGYRWHTVTLKGLAPNTEYFYRVVSGSDSTPVHAFRSAPDSTYRGHLRVLLIGDSRTDTARFAQVIRESKRTLERLYGPDLHTAVQLIAHVGDIVGSGDQIAQYEDEFLRPLSPLSASIPTMVAIGNHENESALYYAYMKYESVSPVQPPDPLAEKWYAFSLADTRFVFLNSNLGAAENVAQTAWLDGELRRAEADASTDFVFAFVHAPGHSEIWPDGNSDYVENDILGLLRSCTKTQQLAYGHSHAYERGAAVSTATNSRGDMLLLECGGGGSELDRWGLYANQADYPEIDATYDQYSFVIIDVDVADASLTGSAWTLGNPDRPVQTTLLDTWHRKLHQSPPSAPTVLAAVDSLTEGITLSSTPFSGSDSIMSARVQITTEGDTTVVLDTMRNWRDVYGVDQAFRPIDRNAGIDLTRLRLPDSLFHRPLSYSWRVQYRDQNLRWSPWSQSVPFKLSSGIAESRIADDGFGIRSIFPNPVGDHTILTFGLSHTARTELDVFNVLGEHVRTLLRDVRVQGLQTLAWDGSDDSGARLRDGLYLLRLRTDGRTATAKVLLLR